MLKNSDALADRDKWTFPITDSDTFEAELTDHPDDREVGIGATGARMERRKYSLVWVVMVSLLSWCQDTEPMRLVGVGSTFPLRMYSRCLKEYEKTRMHVHASYLPFGSVRGVEVVATGTADFGGSEVPIAPRSVSNKMLFFPVAVGAIVPIYNLPGITEPLRFTPKALAGIYLGKITRWDDPAIAEPNSEMRLPAREIVVIHSAQQRGSTYIWSDYLSKVSAEWRSRVGRGVALAWPVGTEVDGNGNVTKAVKNTVDSIGFVESGYAIQERLQQGIVQNAAGKFVTAEPASISAAASECVKSVKADFLCSITNPTGEVAYPIASFTWFVLPENASSPEKHEAVKDMLRWILKEGQGQAKASGLVKVPDVVLQRELKAIEWLR